jgi:hypothetical protein
MTRVSSSKPIELVDPFLYPSEPHARKHGPAGYTDYSNYKPWLRDDFTFRCVYCLSPETWYPSGAAGFSIDHIQPQVLRPDLVTAYSNLVYSCIRCNSIKREVSSLPDPTKTALGELLSVDESGTIKGNTKDGLMMIDILHLNGNAATTARLQRLLVLKAKRKLPEDPDIDRIYRLTFGYPADIDDLRRKNPPGRNSLEGSESCCCFAKREQGQLPEVY